MPEKPAAQDTRSTVRPQDDGPVPQAPTSDRDAKTRDTETPEDEKRIERFRER